MWEKYSYLELSSIQMSEPNNRPTVRNLILAKSQTPSLINWRCRLSFIAKCVSLSHAVCGCWSTLSSVSINTHTHTLYLSLSLRYLALFPHLFVSLKISLCNCLIINWNTDFNILACSHFKGNTNMKLSFAHVQTGTSIREFWKTKSFRKKEEWVSRLHQRLRYETGPWKMMTLAHSINFLRL
jgi:hypothetical protein